MTLCTAFTMKLPYEIFVSLRYLRTKKRYGTISLNTFISIAGVVIGVATSLITLAVMTGFQGYFRDKILSAMPHIVVMEYTGSGVTDKDTLQQKGTTGQACHGHNSFYLCPSMLTTKDRMQGVVVRGIDPKTEGKVTDLAKNMTVGRRATWQSRWNGVACAGVAVVAALEFFARSMPRPCAAASPTSARCPRARPPCAGDAFPAPRCRNRHRGRRRFCG